MNTEKPISIVIKDNNCACKEVCALCGFVDRAESPFDAFIEGTYKWVCPQCADKHMFRGFARLVGAMNRAAHDIVAERAQ